MRKIFLIVFALLFVACSSNVAYIEQKANIQVSSSVNKLGEKVYEKCIDCHGTHGEHIALGKSKVIRGWEAKRVSDALYRFKDDSYSGTMKKVIQSKISNLSDEEIEQVSLYVSKLK